MFVSMREVVAAPNDRFGGLVPGGPADKMRGRSLSFDRLG